MLTSNDITVANETIQTKRKPHHRAIKLLDEVFFPMNTIRRNDKYIFHFRHNVYILFNLSVATSHHFCSNSMPIHLILCPCLFNFSQQTPSVPEP